MTGFGENGIEIRGINATIDKDVVANYKQVGSDRIKPWPILSQKKQVEYLRRIQQGENELVDEFYLRNLGLIYYMVDNDKQLRMLLKDESDRLSYAMEGFMYAVKSFDVEKKIKFDSYACMCMEWYVKKGNREIRAIETGLSKGELHKVDEIVSKMKNAQEVAAEEGVTATPEDLAELLNMPVETVRECLEIGEALYHKYSLDGIQENESSGIEIIRDASDSDRILFSESGLILDGVYVENVKPDTYIQYRYGERKRSDERINPERIVSVEMAKQNLEKVLTTLTEREADILRKRYGIGTRPHTFAEIASTVKNYSCEERYQNKEGIGASRVGQITEKALRKLRHPSRSKYLLPALRAIISDGEEYPIRYKRTVMGEYPLRRDVIPDKDEKVNITLSTELLRESAEEGKIYPLVDDLDTSYDEENGYPYVKEIETEAPNLEMQEKKTIQEETVAEETAETIGSSKNTNDVVDPQDLIEKQLEEMYKEYRDLKAKQEAITAAEQALGSELSNFAAQRKDPEVRIIRAEQLLAKIPDVGGVDGEIRESLKQIIATAQKELEGINSREKAYRETEELPKEPNSESKEIQGAKDEMKATVEKMIDDLLSEDR